VFPGFLILIPKAQHVAEFMGRCPVSQILVSQLHELRSHVTRSSQIITAIDRYPEDKPSSRNIFSNIGDPDDDVGAGRADPILWQ
jgi:hypothetical protein